MLDIFISSRVRRKIIIVFAKYPDFKIHVRGLSKIIKENSGNIQRELAKLKKVGFLVATKSGNTWSYQTNKQFPIFRELQSIVIKTQQQQAKAKAERAARRVGKSSSSNNMDNQIIQAVKDSGEE